MASDVDHAFNSAFWEVVLGVDASDVAGLVGDEDSFRQWMQRFSAAFRRELANWVAARAGVALGAGGIIDALLYPRARAAVQEAIAVDRYLQGRRREALESFASMAERWDPPLVAGDLASERERHLLIALRALAHFPDRLLWYALLDRGVRVRYREYRLAGGTGGALASLGEAIAEIGPRQVEAELQRLLGPGERGRCLDVIPAGEGETMIFAMVERSTRLVRRIDGVFPENDAEWLILRFTERGHRLQAHGPPLGPALAETLLKGLDSRSSVAYRPHRPETPRQAVEAFLEGILSADDVGLYDLDVHFRDDPRLAWRIYGDVRQGLRRLAETTGESSLVRAMTWSRVSFRCRPDADLGYSRVTLWAHPGTTEENRLVLYRVYGADHAERDAVVRWLADRGVESSPS